MTQTQTVKILVVDDSIIYRKVVGDILNEFPDVECVGSATNGQVALNRINALHPDILILDIEMPELNGLEVLAHIHTNKIDIGVIMLSSFTTKGSDMTIKAMELGAFDFIPKPETSSIEESKRQIQEALRPMIKAYIRQKDIQNILRGKSSGTIEEVRSPRQLSSEQRAHHKSEVVAIGISTGGPKALAAMIPKLPVNLNVPVVLVQHMPPMFTASLAKSLDSKSPLKVMEAQNSQPIRPNEVIIAPGGKQMRIKSISGSKVIELTDDPAENSCRPSVDYLFRSVAQHYGARATGVIMTGMGRDGASGIRAMRKCGAISIVQDAASCVVYGMPKEVIDAGDADIIAPLDTIAEEIAKTVRK